jgi:hypothetical protein
VITFPLCLPLPVAPKMLPSLNYFDAFFSCHPERNEGSWFLPEVSDLVVAQTEAKVPRCARDDRSFQRLAS